VAEVECCIGRGLAAVRPRAEVDGDFVLAALKLYECKLEKLGSGSTFGAIKRDDLESLEIPLPPLKEQKRIAAILNEQMGAVERARAAAEARLEAAKALPAAYLRAVFSGPEAQRWPRRRLEELSSSDDGFADGPFGSNLKTEHYTKTGARVVRLQNIGRGDFLDEDKAFVSPDHYSALVRHSVRAGDVIVAALGDGARPAGRACQIPEGFGPGIVKADCFRVRLAPERVSSEYLLACLNSPDMLSRVADAMRGATRPRVTLSMLRQVEIPLPALADQQRIAAILNNRMASTGQTRKAIEAELDTINKLPAALLRRAFNGEL
jgi:type I restriction enzyme S subunit